MRIANSNIAPLCRCETRRNEAILKRGFTLMELLVYMAIVGIVVVIAGEAFSNSTRFRIRTDNMIRATQEAENVATLFKEDVSQMGAKSAMDDNVVYSGVQDNVYMDATNADDDKKDSSSFILTTDDDGFSDLKTRRLRYGSDGAYRAVEEIHWYVENKELKRTCRIVDKAEGFALSASDICEEDENPTAVTMATGITEFKVEAASPGVKEEETQLFPPSNQNEFRLIPRVDSDYLSFDTTTGGTEITVSGFYSNYNTTEETYLDLSQRKKNQVFVIKKETTNDNWSASCNQYGKMTLKPDTVYEVSFNLSCINCTPSSSNLAGVDQSLMFVPGVDHMSVGFRKAGSGDYAKKNDKILLDDFLFYPPASTDGAGKRTMRFTVPERIDNVCLVFTFAMYSPQASLGKIKIGNVKVTQIAASNYKFNGFDSEALENIKEKKNVKALRLKLQVTRGAKGADGRGETGNVDLIIPAPSNGPRD